MELSQQKKNYASIDIAKLICSVMVIMIHISPFGFSPANPVMAYMNFGICNWLCRIAVPLFFAFNGFFLYKKMSADDFSLDYAIKYIKHILKMYLLWSLIYFPFSLKKILNAPEGAAYGFAVYIKDFVFVGSYSHLWYLNALLFAVILIAFMLCKRYSVKKIMCIATFFYVVGLFGNSYYGLLSPVSDIPVAGDIIDLYFKIFEKTRNGLFFAMFYVSMGMITAKKDINISAGKAFLLFAASMLMMGVEVMAVTYFKIFAGYDLLFFGAPACLFCVLFLKQLSFDADTGYVRKISSLVYYLHMMVINLVLGCSGIANIKNTSLAFILTLIVSFLISAVVIILSRQKTFGFLKNLY